VSGKQEPKKSRKPPIEQESILARLACARDEQLYVSVLRWIPDSDRHDGFVLGGGERWVSLAKVDGVSLDGWCLLRRNIQSVFLDPDPLASKVLRSASSGHLS